MNAPIEVQARDAIAARVVALFAFEKQTALNAKTGREEAFSDIMQAVNSAGTLTDEDISSVCSAFSVQATKSGMKKDTVTVRKSELRRIMEHKNLVTEDCKGWNAAIRAIREQTTDALVLVRDEADGLLKSIEKANESLNALISGYQDKLNEERPKGTTAYDIETVAGMVRDAITAKYAGAKVQPVNVAMMLKAPTAGTAVPAATIKDAEKAK